jgi:hypothetical protein
MKMFFNAGLTAAAFLIASSAYGAALYGDYAGGGVVTTFESATGYWFTPTVDVDVVDLGYYDLTGGGLGGAHNVGIFLADGTSVVSALIPSGTAATLAAGTVGGTRIESITATLLTAGTQYYLLADNNTADSFVFGGGVTFDSLITWNSFGDAPGPSITSGIPSEPGGSQGNLGGNFEFVAASAVPEPGSMLMMLSGAALLVGLRRRKN